MVNLPEAERPIFCVRQFRSCWNNSALISWSWWVKAARENFSQCLYFHFGSKSHKKILFYLLLYWLVCQFDWLTCDYLLYRLGVCRWLSSVYHHGVISTPVWRKICSCLQKTLKERYSSYTVISGTKPNWGSAGVFDVGSHPRPANSNGLVSTYSQQATYKPERGN